MLFFLLSISRDQLEFCVVKTAPFHSYSDWPVPVDCERNGFNGTGEFPRVRNAGILLFDGRPKMTWDPQSAPPTTLNNAKPPTGVGFTLRDLVADNDVCDTSGRAGGWTVNMLVRTRTPGATEEKRVKKIVKDFERIASRAHEPLPNQRPAGVVYTDCGRYLLWLRGPRDV